MQITNLKATPNCTHHMKALIGLHTIYVSIERRNRAFNSTHLKSMWYLPSKYTYAHSNITMQYDHCGMDYFPFFLFILSFASVNTEILSPSWNKCLSQTQYLQWFHTCFCSLVWRFDSYLVWKCFLCIAFCDMQYFNYIVKKSYSKGRKPNSHTYSVGKKTRNNVE